MWSFSETRCLGADEIPELVPKMVEPQLPRPNAHKQPRKQQGDRHMKPQGDSLPGLHWYLSSPRAVPGQSFGTETGTTEA